MSQLALQKNSAPSKNRGFTLLFAMLILSIVLSITSSIMGIMVKELKLSGLGRESQYAYYAAESGAECALYWVALGTITGSNSASISCGGETIAVTNSNPFEIVMGGYIGCASVRIIPGSPVTIESRGYNTCDTSKLRVERGIRVSY